jgi:hypothetical protein
MPAHSRFMNSSQTSSAICLCVQRTTFENYTPAGGDTIAATRARDGPHPFSGKKDRGKAWLLSLKGKWFPCDIEHNPRASWITNASESIIGGMSGSPILSDDGVAIGLVNCSTGGDDPDSHTASGACPQLCRNLPGWFLRELIQLGIAKGQTERNR